MNTTVTNKVGRPLAKVTYPRGIFTVADLYELNRGERGRGKRPKISMLTVRKHITAQLAGGFLTQVDSVQSGKVGQPAAQFIRTAVKAGLEAARAARQEVLETPVSLEAPVAEPVAAVEDPAAETTVVSAPAVTETAVLA